MKHDSQGRLTRVEENDTVMNGHSMCNKCGKDMPFCWDTVCFGCRKTFCYHHSFPHKDHWYCLDCLPVSKFLKFSTWFVHFILDLFRKREHSDERIIKKVEKIEKRQSKNKNIGESHHEKE